MVTVSTIQSRVSGIDHRHDVTNPQGRNVVNNRTYAHYRANEGSRGITVEVVRIGPKHSRLRSALHGNGRTFLAKTSTLTAVVTCK